MERAQPSRPRVIATDLTLRTRLTRSRSERISGSRESMKMRRTIAFAAFVTDRTTATGNGARLMTFRRWIRFTGHSCPPTTTRFGRIVFDGGIAWVARCRPSLTLSVGLRSRHYRTAMRTLDGDLVNSLGPDSASSIPFDLAERSLRENGCHKRSPSDVELRRLLRTWPERRIERPCRFRERRWLPLERRTPER